MDEMLDQSYSDGSVANVSLLPPWDWGGSGCGYSAVSYLCSGALRSADALLGMWAMQLIMPTLLAIAVPDLPPSSNASWYEDSVGSNGCLCRLLVTRFHRLRAPEQ